LLPQRVPRSINVKWFKAKGDSITDDTIAINNAINYAVTYNIVNIYFPSGTYMVNSPILIYSNMLLHGDGISSIIRLLPNSANYNTGLITNSDHINGNTNIIIKDLKIDANCTNQDSSYLQTSIYFIKVNKLNIDNVDCTGGLIEGIYIYNCSEININNLTTHNNGLYQQDASGLHIDNCDMPVINNVYSYSNGFHGVILSSCTHGSFNNIRCINNGYDGFRIQYNSDYNFFNNIVSSGNFRGMYFTTESTKNIIDNANIKDNLALGIAFNISANNIFNKCILKENAQGIVTVDPGDNNYFNMLMYDENVVNEELAIGSELLPFMNSINF